VVLEEVAPAPFAHLDALLRRQRDKALDRIGQDVGVPGGTLNPASASRTGSYVDLPKKMIGLPAAR